MTLQQIEEMERALERAKCGTGGPQAIVAWVQQFAPALFDQARAAGGMTEIDVAEIQRQALSPIATLYPGVPSMDLAAHAAGDIKALRTERAARAGYVPAVVADAIEVIGTDEQTADGPYLEALRPFAKLGAPATLDAISKVAIAQGLEWDGEVVITVRDDDSVNLCTIKRAHCERAFELVAEADGGAA